MQKFYEALTSKGKNIALPEEFDFFENLSVVGKSNILTIAILV